MAVLVFAESKNNKFKKAAFEAVFYGYNVAQSLNTECIALTLGNVEDAGALGEFGASKVLNCKDDNLEGFDSQSFTNAIVQVADRVSLTRFAHCTLSRVGV